VLIYRSINLPAHI